MTPLLPINPMKMTKKSLQSDTSVEYVSTDSLEDHQIQSLSCHSLVDLEEKEACSGDELLQDSYKTVSNFLELTH